MAKTKTPIKKVGDKLKKINETFTVYMYDNGFVFEASGKTLNDDYGNVKILCSTIEEIYELMKEAAEMEKES